MSSIVLSNTQAAQQTPAPRQTPSRPPHDNLLRFCHLGLGYDKVNAREHGLLLQCLERNVEHLTNPQAKKQRIVLIMLPRATYKTTIASVSLPMWLLQRDPNLSILVDSETYNLSKSIVSEIKQQYQSGSYAEYYGPTSNKDTIRWAEDSIIIPTRTRAKKEGSLNAAGIDGVKAGMHYPLIIADDLHSQNNTRTPQQIESVREHYRLLLSILEPTGLLIVIGTRWAADDAYVTIMQDADEVLIIPAVSHEPMNHAAVPHVCPLIDTPEGRRQGTMLSYNPATKEAEECSNPYLNFPITLSKEHLERLEKRQDMLIFSAQYILHPIVSRERRFREEWLRYYDTQTPPPDHTPPFDAKKAPLGYKPELPPRLLSGQFRRCIFIDPAFTTAAYSDFTGIIVTATNEKRHIYVAHAEQVKLEPFSLLERIFELCDAWDTADVYVEEEAAQRVLSHFMGYAAKHQDRHVSITPLKSFGKKKDRRIMGLQPYFKNGLIFLRSDQADLIDQIKKYPILKHDDLIDSLAYVPQIIYDGSNIAEEPDKPEGDTFDSLLKLMKQTDAVGIRPLNWRNA